jgi:hypothetical protein
VSGSFFDANPLAVLGLPPEATLLQAERQAQKILGMLELGLPDAATYPTPLGPRPRDADAVRQALAALRGPGSRAMADVFAAASPPPLPADPAPPAWPGALKELARVKPCSP